MLLKKVPHVVEVLPLDSFAEKEHSRRAKPGDFLTPDLNLISKRDVRAHQHAHAKLETDSADKDQKSSLDPAGKENFMKYIEQMFEQKNKQHAPENHLGDVSHIAIATPAHLPTPKERMQAQGEGRHPSEKKHAGSEPSSGKIQSGAEHKAQRASSRVQLQDSTDAMPVLQKGNFQLAHDPDTQSPHRSSHPTSAQRPQHATKSTLHRDGILKQYNEAKEQHKLQNPDFDAKKKKWDDSYNNNNNMYNSRPSFKTDIPSPPEFAEDKSWSPSSHALQASRPQNIDPKTNLTLPIPHFSSSENEKSLVSDLHPAPLDAYPSSQVHKSNGPAIGGIVVGIMILLLIIGVVVFNAGRKRGRFGGTRGRGWMRLGSWKGDKGSVRERLIAGEGVEGYEGQGHWDNAWELRDYSYIEQGRFANHK